EPILVSLPGRKRAQRVDEGMITVDYTPLERLEILLEAIRRAVVLPIQFQVDIASFFSGEKARLEVEGTVSFQATGNLSADQTTAETVMLPAGETASQRAANSEVLRAALTELQAEAQR